MATWWHGRLLGGTIPHAPIAAALRTVVFQEALLFTGAAAVLTVIQLLRCWIRTETGYSLKLIPPPPPYILGDRSL